MNTFSNDEIHTMFYENPIILVGINTILVILKQSANRHKIKMKYICVLKKS